MEDVYLALSLEYHCYPVFITEEMGGVVDCKLPDDWEDVEELDKLLNRIQDVFDSLFVDNEHEFSYVGFKSKEDHNKFVDDLLLAIALIVKKNDGQYRIENHIDREFLKHRKK